VQLLKVFALSEKNAPEVESEPFLLKVQLLNVPLPLLIAPPCPILQKLLLKVQLFNM